MQEYGYSYMTAACEHNTLTKRISYVIVTEYKQDDKENIIYF